MIQKIRQKLKDKKGASTIEFVLCMLIFVMVTAFIIDLFIVSYKHYMVSANCTQAARVISIQGGLSNACPDNYPGGNPNYMTNREFRNYLNELAEEIQGDTGEFKVYIDYSYIDNYDNVIEKTGILVYHYKNNKNGNVTKNYYPQDFLLPYGSFITLRVEYTYEFFYTNIWNDAEDRFLFHSSKSYVTEYVSYDFSYQINGQKILTVVEDLPTLDTNIGSGPSATDLKYFSYAGNTILGFSDEGRQAHDAGLLSNLVIPNHIDGTVITRIEDNAFAGCKKLDSVTISSSIKQIGASAFADCTNLKKVDYFEGLERIDEYAFSNCTNLTFFGPAYTYKDIDAEGKTVVPDRIILPNSLEELHSKAFKSCKKIRIVRVGSNVVKMDDDVFNGSGVNTIYIANSEGSLLGSPWKYTEDVVTGTLVPDTSVTISWNAKRTN